MSELRRAARLVVNAPAIVESIGQGPMHLHPNLAAVFRRVQADPTTVGQRFPAVVRDLSTNGAFISAAPLPLLSRVAVKFELKTIGSDLGSAVRGFKKSMNEGDAEESVKQLKADAEFNDSANPKTADKSENKA